MIAEAAEQQSEAVKPRCPGAWWVRLPAMYAEPVAKTADRTPCRCAACAKGQAAAQAERNGRILASRIPPSRRWQLDTSPGAICYTTRASYGEQLALVRDQTPAAQQGLTLLQACAAYGKPYRETYQAFVWGKGDRNAGVGRRDHWDVWFAERRDLEALWGDTAQRRQAQAATPEHMSRTAERIARRQIQLRGDKAA